VSASSPMAVAKAGALCFLLLEYRSRPCVFDFVCLFTFGE